jgi:uncharacterized FlaG/YvyC family protein
MDDAFDLNIRKVNQTASFKDQEKKDRGKKKKKQETQEDEAREHFKELSDAAERIHKILQQKNSPFRFCVFKQGDEVFIDVVILDSAGGISKTIKKNITHQEFSDIIKNIETLDGVLIDYTV